ncbi:MAG: D-alanyl-D-alanine carboxypeptidase [Clostridia bacterium]|nr:D-alanyl-D-alanine carboxypeptidase [Clostridia bacterium]
MRKLKYFSLLFIVALLVFCSTLNSNQMVVNAVEVGSFNTSAKAMCVLEKDSGRVVASKNMEMQLPMASTTKIVTALTVIQNCNNLDEIIQVDDSAIGVEGSSIYLRKGELISIKDLLYGLMLRSGNDSAVALACHTGGSVEGFAELMNKTAKNIGANNSNFVTPHGLDHKDHYTTAYDLANITAYALNNPIFKEIVSCKQHTVQATNKSDKRYMSNKNRLLNSLSGCIGVKTGFTTKAGRCLVSATERDDETYVCVVLNCGPMFEESASMLNNAHALYENKKIIDKNREIYNEYIIDKNQGKLYLYAEEDFSYPLMNNEMDKLRLEYNVKLDSAKEGEQVGEIKVFFENDLLKTIKLVTMNKIDKLIESDTLEISEILWEEKVNEN